MSIEKVNSHFYDNLHKLQHEAIRESFQNKLNRLLVFSSASGLQCNPHFINYTSLFNSNQHHIGIGTRIKGVQSQFTGSIQYIYTIDLINQISLGLRLNRSETNTSYNYSLYKRFNKECLTTLILDQKWNWKWLIDYNYSQIKIREKGISFRITTKPESETSLSPYIKFNQHQKNNTAVGVRAKLKQFELFLYKQGGLNLGIVLNIEDWKVGFKLSLGKEEGFISLLLSKFGIAVQFPFYQIEYDDLVSKYTCVGFVAILACAVLKCLQQPKIMPPSKEERIRESRKILDLLETKTKQIYLHEKQSNGLLILYAYYGNAQHIQLLAQQQNKLKFHLQSELDILDVTLACQSQVKNSSLTLPNYTKSVLIGFCDPCEETKSLYIEYTYQSVKFSKIFSDSESVHIP